MRRLSTIWFLAVGTMLAGCGGTEAYKAPPKSAAKADIREIRELMQLQLSLAVKGDLEGLKQLVASAARKNITPEVISGIKEKFQGVDIDQLCATIEPEGGREAVVAKKQDGNKLGTFVLEDGKWVSETIWFGPE